MTDSPRSSASFQEFGAANTETLPAHTSVAGSVAPIKLIRVMALACGLMGANLYYAQPLITLISRSLSIAREAGGLIVTFTQLGYGCGLLLLVPLADVLENRRLVLASSGLAFVGLLTAAFAPAVGVFFVAAALLGIGSSTVQILVPYAAHLSPDGKVGGVVGTMTGGLMLGIMLARPLASMVADWWSWRGIFIIAAGAVGITTVVLGFALPPRRPQSRLSYGDLLRSMVSLLCTEPLLRRRALYQTTMFGVFTVYWSTVPMLLLDKFGFSTSAVGAFAAAGVAGVIASPLAGRMADRGRTKQATTLVFICAALAWSLSVLNLSHGAAGVIALIVSAILLDAGAASNLVLGQRTLYELDPSQRGRLNGLFMASFFAGSAALSAAGVAVYVIWGWRTCSGLCLALCLGTLAYHLSRADTAPARAPDIPATEP